MKPQRPECSAAGPQAVLVLATVLAVTLGLSGRSSAGSTHRLSLPEMVTAAATSANVPPELLASIAWIESRGWPWALNIGGVGLYPRNYSDAVKLIRAVRGRADIGVAQIHYPIWGPVFGLRPEDLLDPWINLHVAARILRYAIDQEPESWGGVGRYHSATPWRKWHYARRVAIVARSFSVTSVSPPK